MVVTKLGATATPRESTPKQAGPGGSRAPLSQDGLRSANPVLDPRVAWAKARTDSEGRGRCLSLTDHSVDVAAVAEGLLRSPTLHRRLGTLAGRPLTDADVARISFFAGLHDVGKAVRPFQRRLRDGSRASHTAPVWVLFGSGSSPSETSRRVGGALRQRRWRTWFATPGDQQALWDVVLAHHGSLPTDQAPATPSDWEADSRTGYDPLAAVREVVAALEGMFPDAFGESGMALPATQRFLHALAGCIVLADWLGSDERRFLFPNEGGPEGTDRIRWSRETAMRLLRDRWFDLSRTRREAARLSLDFEELFPELGAPRPCQQAVLAAPEPHPGQVVVLEAETGSGKTEAALIHFLRLFQLAEVDGLYFALPTRAAAVQIHRRISETVRRWFGPTGPPVTLAVPGYLRVDDQEGQRLPDTRGVLWDDERTSERGWAAENAKRYLSGAIVVGTIDQALLGGLRVRHAQLRSGPMLRLLLVVDEVHASDAYMTALLRNLLDQHTASGSHALLMSATLGASARERLLRPAPARVPIPALEEVQESAYPSMQRSGEALHPLATDGASRRIAVELLDPATEEDILFTRLRDAAAGGAVVLFIRNRVKDAQRAVLRLEAMGTALFRCRNVAAPHHGRFAPEDRTLLDESLERALGRGRERRGVVAVTTQTAEQSLDICADWLVTDIAPGDVLLQRVGRLHRHPENPRPDGYAEPLVTVVVPSEQTLGGLLQPSGRLRRTKLPLGLGHVYDNLVAVLATRRWLAEHGEIRVPRDSRTLVERVTHDEALRTLAQSLGGAWPEYLEGVRMGRAVEGGAALPVMIHWEEPLADNQKIKELAPPTRLGLRDRRVVLPQACKSPFGSPVRTLNLPEWMIDPDVKDDAQPEHVIASAGTIRFRFGGSPFVYDRLGLRKDMPERAEVPPHAGSPRSRRRNTNRGSRARREST